jgi:DNA replication protein DnaC
MSPRRTPTSSPSVELQRRILEYFQTLRVPLAAAELDAIAAQAEKERSGPLEFLARLIGPAADLRRQRTIERRIHEARFREAKTLEAFDWHFNAKAIDRRQIEGLAAGEFIRRGDNLVLAGQSGVGKSHIVQAVGRAACVLGYRVRYATSAELLRDLTASLADHTLPQRLRYYSNFEPTSSASIRSRGPSRVRRPASSTRWSTAAARNAPPPW